MIFSVISRRRATALRSAGFLVILWSILTSTSAPATSGRGLVVLIFTVISAAAWLTWTFWTSKLYRLTPDLFVLAICGGVLAAASQGSAASALAFVCSVSAAARVGMIGGSAVAASGAFTVSICTLIYDQSALAALAYSLGFVAAALAGSNLRQMRKRAEQAELLLVQTQRSHEEQARASQLEHQAQIARDIHDVLAHSLAGLTIQLEATSVLLEQGASPDSIKERIDRAHQLAREGLHETRRAVGALRGEAEPDEQAGGQEVLAMLRDLAAGYHDAAGESVALTLDGDTSLLSGQVGDTVVRVVQESLTNIRKHAPGASVEVEINSGGDGSGQIAVIVEDRDGAPVVAGGNSLSGTGGGYGLRGMRERAQLTGGTLQAGPTAHGWKVELRIPQGEAA